MKFYSTNNPNLQASFKEAVIRGMAPDKGLYVPERITPLPEVFFKHIDSFSLHEMAFEAIRQFVSEAIPDTALQEIIANTLDFAFPVVPLQHKVATLELFHGPTMAFKDVGARFMAQCLGYFFKDTPTDITVLVATSGDTGGAVANGFLGVDGVHVVILYPSGKVSPIQEQQLTTLGQNITAFEVDGAFDDCQRMVKTAFLDADLTAHRQLTSANSINVGRWLPQLFYFLSAYQQVKAEVYSDLVFSVPSGNLGSVCAGLIAQRLGLPVNHFVVATNANDTVPRFMTKGVYEPRPSVATLSNAMDIGDPSNFARIRHLFGDDVAALRQQLSAYAFSDAATQQALREVYAQTGYVMDPHGAVGYLGLKQYQTHHPEAYGIFLETAHPVKFLEVIQDTLDITPDMPRQLQGLLEKDKQAIPIQTYEELKAYLLEH